MNHINPSACLLRGKGDTNAEDICQSLTQEGITAIVKQRNPAGLAPADGQAHWSGQPGQDLFFNGWKLLF